MSKRSKTFQKSERSFLSKLGGFYRKKERIIVVLCSGLIGGAIGFIAVFLERRVSYEATKLFLLTAFVVGIFLFSLDARRKKRIRQKRQEELLS